MAYLKHGKLWAIIALLPAMLALPGCGGFSGSHGVSPASFFVPGLVQTQPNQEHKPAVVAVDERVNPSIFTNSESGTFVSNSD
jgi:hypothetical protein